MLALSCGNIENIVKDGHNLRAASYRYLTECTYAATDGTNGRLRTQDIK
jgi:hypothetical protein